MGEILEDEIGSSEMVLGQPSKTKTPQVHLSKTQMLKSFLNSHFSTSELLLSYTLQKEFFKFHNVFQGFASSKINQSLINYLNSEEFLRTQVSSVNVQANARSCALLAAMMSEKNKSLVTPKTWDLMHSEPKLDILHQGQSCQGQGHSNFNPKFYF